MSLPVPQMVVRADHNPSEGSANFYVIMIPEDATGTISIFVDQTFDSSDSLTSFGWQECSVTFSGYDVGDHLITFVYSGDDNYAPTSVVVVQTLEA